MEALMKNIRFATLFAFFPLFWTCSTEAALQQILGSSVQSPVFYGSAASADGGISFSFSTPVTLESAYFDPPLELESCTASAEGETGGKLTFYFSSDLPEGSKVTADILAEDRQGNTLNVLVPFRTRNTQVPRLIINEIRTENSNMSTEKPRTEFVELFMLSGGNLGALRLFAAGNKSGKGLEAPIMEFPPVMVAAGEYVVVHCRTLPSQPDCLDETGSNLGASGGYEATPARDFWIPGSAARIHNTDVIFIMDQDGMIIDGAVLCEKEEAWKNDIVPAARLLAEQGIWNGSDPASAVSTVKATATKTVNRTQSAPAGSAAGWYIKESSNESPGAPNK
jgi:hypothetical protein